jgi:hypothetical protein
MMGEGVGGSNPTQTGSLPAALPVLRHGPQSVGAEKTQSDSRSGLPGKR